MAKFTIGLQSGPATGSRTYTLSDADVTRWIAALRKANAFNNPALTDQQVLAQWADSIMARQKTLVRSAEREAAEKAARTAITDIGIS